MVLIRRETRTLKKEIYPQEDRNQYDGQNVKSEQENLPPRQKKINARKYLKLLYLLPLIPIVYFAVQVFIVISPRMRTDVVKNGTMTDYMTVNGQVVLDSQPIYSDMSGYIYYTVQDGERVSDDTEVAQFFATEAGVEAMDIIAAADEELDRIQEASQTVVEGSDLENLLDEMQTGLYSLLNAMEANNYSELESVVGQLSLADNKIQIATGEATDFDAYIESLESLKDEYEILATPIGVATVSESGYFVSSELQDVVSLDYEAAAGMEPVALQQTMNDEPVYHDESVLGHMVKDYKWSYFTTVSASDAQRFVVGDKSLRLRFPNSGGMEVSVEVESVTVDEVNDIAKIELFCDEISADVLSMHVEEAEIIFGVEQGVRIPKEALRLVNETNEDGSVSTHQGVYIQFGNMVYFRHVEIILEDEYYLLAPWDYEDGVNEIQLYDTVVVDPGGVELYDRKIL